MICIKTFSSRPEAELARGILEASGIPALVAVDDAGGTRPELAFTTGGSKLFVDSHHVAAATELLQAQVSPELVGERVVLASRLDGCMTQTLLGILLFVVGAFAAQYLAAWLRIVVLVVAAVLLVVALVRGTRRV